MPGDPDSDSGGEDEVTRTSLKELKRLSDSLLAEAPALAALAQPGSPLSPPREETPSPKPAAPAPAPRQPEQPAAAPPAQAPLPSLPTLGVESPRFGASASASPQPSASPSPPRRRETPPTPPKRRTQPTLIAQMLKDGKKSNNPVAMAIFGGEAFEREEPSASALREESIRQKSAARSRAQQQARAMIGQNRGPGAKDGSLKEPKASFDERKEREHFADLLHFSQHIRLAAPPISPRECLRRELAAREISNARVARVKEVRARRGMTPGSPRRRARRGRDSSRGKCTPLAAHVRKVSSDSRRYGALRGYEILADASLPGRDDIGWKERFAHKVPVLSPPMSPRSPLYTPARRRSHSACAASAQVNRDSPSPERVLQGGMLTALGTRESRRRTISLTRRTSEQERLTPPEPLSPPAPKYWPEEPESPSLSPQPRPREEVYNGELWIWHPPPPVKVAEEKPWRPLVVSETELRRRLAQPMQPIVTHVGEPQAVYKFFAPARRPPDSGPVSRERPERKWRGEAHAVKTAAKRPVKEEKDKVTYNPRDFFANPKSKATGRKPQLPCRPYRVNPVEVVRPARAEFETPSKRWLGRTSSPQRGG